MPPLWEVAISGTAAILGSLLVLALGRMVRRRALRPLVRTDRRATHVISHFFIDRPIFATVLSIVFVLAGGVAVFTLPVAQSRR